MPTVYTEVEVDVELEDFEVDVDLEDFEVDAGITMHANGSDEMIKVTKDGFYVRGKKVKQDDKEAETVYNAFKQWLSWAQLQR